MSEEKVEGTAEESEEKLRVVAVAIRDKDGKIHTLPAPARHHNVIWKMAHEGLETGGPDVEQGFLLSDGRFARRRAAKFIAAEAGQLLPRALDHAELFSEDVW